jgi:hypothetical protein
MPPTPEQIATSLLQLMRNAKQPQRATTVTPAETVSGPPMSNLRGSRRVALCAGDAMGPRQTL